MINFYLYHFVLGQQFLKQELSAATVGAFQRPNEIVPPADHARISQNISNTIEYCVDVISLREAISTGIQLRNEFNSYDAQPYTWGRLHTLLERGSAIS
jgi:hypothetical protein